MRAALLVRVCVYVRACVCECVPHRNLFNSQQTWLLVVTQVVLVLGQVAATLGLSWRDEGYEGAA